VNTDVWIPRRFALVFLQDTSHRTLLVGLTTFQSRSQLDVPLVVAGMWRATIPMMILAGQRFSFATSPRLV
jgi:ABC-type glycerol-3-phosphate transport system permease component